MKKIFFLPVLAFIWGACLIPDSSAAQEAPGAFPGPILNLGAIEQPRPALTSSLTIALAYYKLTARAPDFESWIKQQDAYQNANVFDKPAVMDNMAKKLKNAYNSLLLSEPLIMEMQVVLSPYEAKNEGYFIGNFKRSTFFPARYAGQSYAIVPQNLMDKQWLKIDDPAVIADIEKAAAADNRILTMVMYMVPRYADAKSPAVIDGENYWPIAADIRKMMLYQPGTDTLLWQSTNPTASDKTHQSILNLYQ